jgi:hypothetical protein
MGSCNITYGLMNVYDHVHDGRFFFADYYFKYARVMSFELDSLGKAEAHGIHLETAAAHFEFKGVKVEADLLDFSCAADTMGIHPVSHMEVGMLQTAVQGMTNKITVEHMKLAGVQDDFHVIEQIVGAMTFGQKLSVHSLPQTGPFA